MADFVAQLAAIDARIIQLTQSCTTITQTVADLVTRVDTAQTEHDNIRAQFGAAPIANADQRRAREDMRTDLQEARAELTTLMTMHDRQASTLRDEQRTLDNARAHRASIAAHQATAASAAAVAAAAGAGPLPGAQAGNTVFTDKDWSSAMYWRILIIWYLVSPSRCQN